jgi:hypothetical protein
MIFNNVESMNASKRDDRDLLSENGDLNLHKEISGHTDLG